MLYKLLGMAVWKGGKVFLQRKYGTAMLPKPVLAGGLLLALAGGAIAVVGRARRAV
jgi:hypothetical protein